MPHRFDALDLPALHQRRSAKWSKYPQDVIPAWVAEMDYPLAEPVAAALQDALRRHDLGYAPPVETTEVGSTVAEWGRREFGWELDPSAVMVVPDVVKGIQIVLQALTEPGDGVVIQPPVYPPFFSLVPHAGRRLIQNPLAVSEGRYEIDLDHLDRCLDEARVLMLCNPQNPTGRSFSRDELTEVAELALRHGVLIVSDEIHAPLTFPASKHVALATLGEEVDRNTVTVTAASKAWNFGGLKCGLIVPGSPDAARALKDLPWLTVSGASILGIEATVAALGSGQPWMDEVVDYLDGNRRLLAERLTESGLPFGYRQPEATYLAWLDCRPIGLEDPFSFFLDQSRVALSDGKGFGAEGEGFVRLNLATSRAILEQIVGRMVKAVESGRRP